ncbi:cytochrome c-type biogenesis protein [Allochromatium vinosum]|uniref:Cytochrome c-type biogenesis protein n=1 Tax=Allochromatium vinosum (strain ATCC 17899 / DSM 180 / NBRC 103801 / NCIMB 10441 / D) TaxID=572477 RepID=D3RVT9_ALLVD|nr:cytochrome c-type biogenesis protein [Allochromatium vinosum]ADC63102.1 cytochrome C biogenesis protein [Allochromatium vinosum DSM 180]MBK1655820.1 cytochrome c-type biogenesis protein CcmH [Allochromatium vinosum]
MIRTQTQSLVAALTLAGALLTTAPAHAFTLEEFTFEDPARTQEFRDLTSELRCLVCQNESLAGSQAGVAQDLRKEVYRLMQEGKSRQEVIDFLVERYGDFVLYEPPLKPSTLVLWFGPFLFVGFGAYLLARTLQRKKAEPEQDLSEAERARLQQLLAKTGDQHD